MTRRQSEETAEQETREQAVEEGLTAIFKDDAGEMPDLKTFEPRRSRWWLYACLAACAFLFALLAAAWAGFSVFKPFRGFSGQGLAIVIEGPERVALGEETTYFINYQNRTSEPISAASLKISFPSDFVLASVEPASAGDGRAWTIDGIPVDGRGTMKIRGTFTGALGTQTAIQVVGTYKPVSSQAGLDALATKVLSYTESVLSGTVEIPEKVLPGDHVVLTYHIENTGQDPFEALVAHVTTPEGFQLDATSTYRASGRMIEIPVGTLSPGASSTLRVPGSFASGASGEARVIAETGRVSPEGVFLSSQRIEATCTVLAGDLSLKLVVNGLDHDAPIAYGIPLRIGIGYENTASEDVEDIRIRWRVEQESPTGTTQVPLLDWTTLAETSSATRQGASLEWDAKSIPTLERLSPREEGSIGFTVNGVSSASGTAGLAFRLIAEADMRKVGSTVVHRVVRAAPIVLRYSSDVKLSAEARYFSEEGAPLGSGPLPPLVGQTTTYRVEWRAQKRFHELANLKIRATLPSGVAWTGTTIDDAGSLVYDEATRSVTWTLNRMPADVNEQTIRFDLAVTPSEADAGRFAKLVGETRFEATDSVTGELMSQVQPALTTDLETDESASGKGVVRKP